MLEIAKKSGLAPNRFLPPDSPLPMPAQSFWQKPESRSNPRTAPRSVPLRRGSVLFGTFVLTALAAHEMYLVLSIGGLSALEIVVLCLFVMLFAWIAFSFVSAVAGFVTMWIGPERSLGIDSNAPLPSLTSHNALLLPTYNEEPHRVLARLHAIYESVEETGKLAQFDFFILSDTTDPDIWIKEEAAYLALIKEVDPARVFYRHRSKNVGRKAGNISEWVIRFGGRYDNMIVLDADSLMTGDTIVRLAGAMDAHQQVGLIQTLPILVNGSTLFARSQQFAGRAYGPLVARGIAWWHGSESNYWGHNAIIRVKAFAEQAGLPLLPGPKPFGGHILSHDFVEAALLRRAGWGVHLITHLTGSYEECPPSLTDYAVRDRRWCQGNLQHLGVLPARGLHWVSRLHLMTGIGSYITSPLWLLFLLVGILISLQAQFIRPEYFTERSLFPQWPAQDPVRAAWVFAGTMGILLSPKILGYLVLLKSSGTRRGFGGALVAFGSVIAETIISGLIAPIMMLMQSRSIMEIAIGRDSGWQPQQREGGKISISSLLRAYGWPTMLGLLLSVGAYAISVSLFLWMTPVLIGLVLALPLAAFTSSLGLGAAFKKMGLLSTPEESDPPRVLARANALAASFADRPNVDALTLLSEMPELLSAHLATLPLETDRRRGGYDADLLVARAKVDDSESIDEAVSVLSVKETFSVLSNFEALSTLMAKRRGSLVTSH